VIQAAAFEKKILVRQENKFVKVAGEDEFFQRWRFANAAGLVKADGFDKQGVFFEVYSFDKKRDFFREEAFDQKGGLFEVYGFYEKKDFFKDEGSARLIFFGKDKNFAAAKFGFFRDSSPVWSDRDSGVVVYKDRKNNENWKPSERVFGLKAEDFSKRVCSFA
jgi:hypothetical protein